MRVKAVLEREGGEYRPAMGSKAAGTGDLPLTYRTARNRRVAVLQLLGADRQWPNLYDPRLVDLAANRLRFVGVEKFAAAWVLPEWVCELPRRLQQISLVMQSFAALQGTVGTPGRGVTVDESSVSSGDLDAPSSRGAWEFGANEHRVQVY